MTLNESDPQGYGVFWPLQKSGVDDFDFVFFFDFLEEGLLASFCRFLATNLFLGLLMDQANG